MPVPYNHEPSRKPRFQGLTMRGGVFWTVSRMNSGIGVSDKQRKVIQLLTCFPKFRIGQYRVAPNDVYFSTKSV